MEREAESRHIIYIPGFGDKYDAYRHHALRLWRTKNLTIELLPMNWRDPEETHQQKLERLVTKITSISESATVVLVGESAGGAMALVASQVCKKEVAKTITICGKNVRADRVSPKVYIRCPAFRETIEQADLAAKMITPADIDRYATFYSPFDPVIAADDTKLPHIPLKRLPIVGHLLTIFVVLYFYWPIITKEALRSSM